MVADGEAKPTDDAGASKPHEIVDALDTYFREGVRVFGLG
jgi:hypothetical protein